MKKILATPVYTTSTLMRLSKQQLIEQVRMLEHNWEAALEKTDNQAKVIECLLEEQQNKLKKKPTDLELRDRIAKVVGSCKCEKPCDECQSNRSQTATPCNMTYIAVRLMQRFSIKEKK